jgi:hypothetical protein
LLLRTYEYIWAICSDAKIHISSASYEDRLSRADIAASFQVSYTFVGFVDYERISPFKVYK